MKQKAVQGGKPDLPGFTAQPLPGVTTYGYFPLSSSAIKTDKRDDGRYWLNELEPVIVRGQKS